MPIKILMPALSPTMTEGNLARWLKKEGDAVKAGDVIAEIETDKATMEVEAVDEGRLGKILVGDGAQNVKVNDVIALLLEEGENPSVLASVTTASPAPLSTAVSSTMNGKASQPNAPLPSKMGSSASHPEKSMQPTPMGGRVFASPLARRIAEQNGINLNSIKGSGPNGRVVVADLKAGARGRSAELPMAKSGPVAFGEPLFELKPHSTMRKTIARRLTESKQQVPHFYLSLDCTLDRLLKLRTELNARSPESGPDSYKLSVNDFIIRACALALQKVPDANTSWSDEGVKYYKSSDISVAVAIPNGLITPIIREAEKKRLPEISKEMKDLADKAKAGKLKPEDYTGGSFSLSNLGMFGIKSFSAIINPPQGCILAIGAGEQRPIIQGGEINIANMMSVTLSVDHRVVDGVIGANFLSAFKALIEDPLGLVI